ncbi:MAG TPA: hypothetical protein VH206_03275, partial [Xanthobacteraceae bacterium]|nr:hypothetical protein [Xanthobacteraceae bacterium]
MTRLPLILSFAMLAACGAAIALAEPIGSLGVGRAEAAEIGGANQSSACSDSQSGGKLTPEQLMQSRFPQPARVGHLVELPVLDENDSTIGYVREIVKTSEGKVLLIVPYSPWFGWARTERGKRAVAVPIEA